MEIPRAGMSQSLHSCPHAAGFSQSLHSCTACRFESITAFIVQHNTTDHVNAVMSDVVSMCWPDLRFNTTDRMDDAELCLSISVP